MDRGPVLALNETRKTLLASRLRFGACPRTRHTVRGLRIFPGDGIWVESCKQVDTSGMPVPLDLLFLDADHRVVAKVTHVPPGERSPRISVAHGVLELPAGTIVSTNTEIGDRILIEAIVAGRTAS
jgi:uncharacterized protein